MRRSRRKRRIPEGIELNLAAMLDMAFQLLMFFILTFNPAPAESQFAAYIPTPKPVTQPKMATNSPSTPNAVQQVSYEKPLLVSVAGSSDGKIQHLSVSGKKVADLAALNATLHNEICRQGDKCDQVTVEVAANLCYEELMQVVDICTQQKLPKGGTLSKLKLVELRPE